MNEKEKLIKEKVDEEDFIEMMQLRGVKQIVWKKLIEEKGFNPGEVAIDPQYKLTLTDCEAIVSTDFVIELPAASFAVIRCANSGLEFWERYVIAFARSVKDYQIPFAMVTNGEAALILDVLSGSIIGNSMQVFFDRQGAISTMMDFKKIECPSKKLERAKRIIYAFEGVKCPSVQPESK